jgi:dihydrofolate reductase
VHEVVLIAAHDRQRAIGRGNALPWHLPDDLARFKRLTVGGTVLMGRKTAESIGRALPQRRNLVLTRGASAPYAGQDVVDSLDAACIAAGTAPLFVIGGGEVYALALPRATRLELTLVDTVVEGADAWFPPFDAAQWRQTARIPHPADARHACAFAFVTLERRAP